MSAAAENLKRQTSLADAIAANLSAGREAGEQQQSPAPEQSNPVTKREDGASRPSHPPRVEADGSPSHLPDTGAELDEQATGVEETPAPQQESIATENSTEQSARWTLSDFAEAAETDVDTLLSALEVEVTGKDGKRTTTLGDVLNGYRFNAANTQRAQEIAEQRREIEQKEAQAAAKLAEVTKAQDAAEAVIRSEWDRVEERAKRAQAQYESVPWDQLRAKGDGSYADAEAQFAKEFRSIDQERNRLRESYASVERQRREMAERHQSEVLPRAREQLLEAIPEWKDDSVARKEGEAIAQYAVNRYGFNTEELDAITDPRAVRVLRRLWQLEQQLEGTPIAKKVVKEAPKMMRPGQRAAKGSAQAERVKAMRSRLKRTGKAQDLASLLKERGFS